MRFQRLFCPVILCLFFWLFVTSISNLVQKWANWIGKHPSMPIAVNITDSVAQYWEEGKKSKIFMTTHEASTWTATLVYRKFELRALPLQKY